MLGLIQAARVAHAGWSADAAVERFDLHEHTSPTQIRETGPQFALGLGFIKPGSRGFLFEYHGRVYGGGVDYNGTFQFDQTRTVSGTSTYLGTRQGGGLRYRWTAADAVAGIDLDLWRRTLSSTQRETYRIATTRLGAERPATPSSPIVAGGGVRFVLATNESARIEADGYRYDLSLSPGSGASPYLYAGYRVAPRATLFAYWDSMRLGRSNRLLLVKRGQPVATVSQPATDIHTIGMRLEYGF